MNLSVAGYCASHRQAPRFLAGVLMVLFIALRIFPVVHILAEHDCHAPVCEQAERPASDANAFDLAASTHPSTCFGCEVAAQLQYDAAPDAIASANLTSTTPYPGRAPDTLVFAEISPANRAQAPPAVG